ncbi:unnamed protein product [Acanthoscelides obtectus]|uniref:Uncharacterized protein n=1 Tax=Acanthoscelides obtectus TaxID=200917 RepID=A0A9P0KR83_ACAOB|nr:unnamed protein product [Acanthoscelides obtectus]CAK1684487.1 hypothetical protein AOBTE_LOCUS34880 [Acanthoscelides obtectus]
MNILYTSKHLHHQQTTISEDKRLLQDVRLLCDVRRYHAYAALNAKNQLRAPSEWGVVLRPEAEPLIGSTAGGAEQERRRLEGGGAASGAELDGAGEGGGRTTDKGGGGGEAEQLRCLACDSERVRSCWVTAMRLAKFQEFF